MGKPGSNPLSLCGPSLQIQPLQQQDVFLMDAFVAYGYEGKELQTLNDCRLHLKATLLSHICTARGNSIEPRAWAGQQSLTLKPPSWVGTYKPRPESWELWKAALRTVFLQPNTASLRLRSPMGRWLQPKKATWRWWRPIPSLNTKMMAHGNSGAMLSLVRAEQNSRRRCLWKPNRFPIQCLGLVFCSPQGLSWSLLLPSEALLLQPHLMWPPPHCQPSWKPCLMKRTGP